ncbi:SDR family NAD(P)-dependent oxidoreductase [Bacillus sp. 1P06AnD]|uniref:SDR family NAD(P)-dependent oxidoreductase n=1 Tax=Bacillus sp. 1P06AnD TaxID=3132208 RepID=UPI0039A1C558
MVVKLKNKRIVITGASAGLGERLAYKAAEKGALPILIARSEDKLNIISEEVNRIYRIKPVYYKADIGVEKEVAAVFADIKENIGSVDILVNNAGFGVYDLVADADMDDYKEMFAVNVFGVIACTKAVLPDMLANNRGHIINIASQAGKVATPKSSGYSATKHAVLGFTNSLRLELLETAISVSTVNPGPIETNFFDRADKSGTYKEKAQKMMMDADHVAGRIVHLMEHPKRELNLPGWMNLGSTLYNLFPTITEKIAGKKFNMK